MQLPYILFTLSDMRRRRPWSRGCRNWGTAESEAQSADRDDPGAGTDLLSYAADVHIQSAARGGPHMAPHFGHDLFSGDDRVPPRREEIQEIELLAGQLDEFIAQPDLTIAGIHGQRAVHDRP